MTFYLVLLHIAGAIALLLFSVRMVRTGIERSQRPLLGRILSAGASGGVRAAAIGTGAAVLLQSSTAVAMLAAGFAASGTLSLATGLAILLGADLGSALVVAALSSDLAALVPVLLVAGAVLFFKGANRQWRQGGRVVMGIALILVALDMVGSATAPLRDAPFVPVVIDYLRTDLVTAFLVGAIFTWLVHSSVAALLMIVTFAAQGLVPAELAVPLVLGANLGAGLIAVGLTRQAGIEARRIALGNLVFRGVLAVLLVGFALYGAFAPLHDLSTPAAFAVLLHVGFNLVLLVLGVNLTGPMARLVSRLVRPSLQAEPWPPLSLLDATAIAQPRLALASAKRELLRMAEIIERMLKPLMELYESADPEQIRQVKRLEQAVDKAQADIKLYLSQIEYPEPRGEDARRGNELANFAINLEYVGDAISKTLLKLAETRREENLKFSAQGWRELNELHLKVLQNMQLALSVLMSEDRAAARLLVAEKDAMRLAELKSARGDLERLRAGGEQSLEAGNLYLETVRALRTINSLFASIAYPVLRDSGELRDSRLIADEG